MDANTHGKALPQAIADFTKALADVRGACVRLGRGAELAEEARSSEIDESLRKKLAMAATRTANSASQETLRLRDLVNAIAPSPCMAPEIPSVTEPAGALESAAAVRVGTATNPPGLEASNRSIAVPVIAPLLNSGNIVIQGRWSSFVESLIQEITVRALLSTGSAQLSILGVDPSLRTPLTILDPLASIDDSLFPSAAKDEGSIKELLEGLEQEVRATKAMFRGQTATLGDLRRDLGQPVGVYRLIVVTDYPKDFDDDSAATLADLMRVGPTAGMSFLIQSEEGLLLDDATLQRTTLLEVTREVLSHPGFRNWMVTSDLSRPDARESAVAGLAKGLASAAAPTIGFADIQPRPDLMWDNSATGLVATIGQSGTEPLVVALGDERSQRHNILVSGAVGQGKSNLLMALVHSLAQRYSPDELQMYLLDFKDGVTLFPLSDKSDETSYLPHAALLGLNSDRAYGAAVLQHLVDEFERRAAIIRPHGDNIQKYRAAVPDETLPRLLVVVDEFQVLFEEDDAVADEALASLEKLARKGRAYGIHLVLASQTLSGITKLLAKQDGIFSQFPIRLALKNSASESRAVLDQGNTGAAKLRLRGEVILNNDFGVSEANQRGIVAYADDEELADLRRRLLASIESPPSPTVFDGATAANLSQHVAFLKRLRRRASNSPGSDRLATLGTPMGVSGDPTGFIVSPDSARNLAVIGAGTSSGFTLEESVDENKRQNLALGALQSAAVSLALQHPDANARFVLLDFLTPAERKYASGLERMLQMLGMATQMLSGLEASNWFLTAEQVLDQQHQSEDSTYVIGLGLDRAPRLMEQSDSFETPVDGLHRILKDGPLAGLHLLGWWGTLKSYQDQVGLTAEGAVQGFLALRVSAMDIQDLFGAYETWRPSPNRGLLVDRVSAADSGVIVPFQTLDQVQVRALTQEDWDS